MFNCRNISETAGLLLSGLLSPSLIVDAEVDEETMEGAHFCHGQELIQWQHSTFAVFIQLRGQWGHLKEGHGGIQGLVVFCTIVKHLGFKILLKNEVRKFHGVTCLEVFKGFC